MTVLVNYYTCSYGDSLVNMFNGNKVLRVNGIANCSFNGFVEPDFYNKNAAEQQNFWKVCKSLSVASVPCHRQNKFNFSQVFGEPVKVITIELDQIEFLPYRFKKIHLDGRGKEIKNPMLSKLLSVYPDRFSEIITRDYLNWIALNKTATDVTFFFSWFNSPDKVRDFCKQHDLAFDNDWLNNIQQDLHTYALL
jgi:hypothetical protein